MLLWIVFTVALIYCILKPYSDGFLNTSLWLAKIMAPSDVPDGPELRQLLKVTQAAIMDGWPSNVPFLTTLLGATAMILAFIYAWWMGIAMYLVLAIGGMITSRIIIRPVTFYIAFLFHRMTNRIADYKRKNDTEREEAARETNEDLKNILAIYTNSGIGTPTKKLVKENPYGDIFFLRNLSD
jgi:hypothetical protein